MRLTKIRITKYRSIQQTEELIVDSRVTILIGANDHGKSNILSALQCLNDDKEISQDDINWDASPDATVEIRWHFKCSPADIERLITLSLSPGQLESPENKDLEFIPAAPGADLVYSRNSRTNKVEVETVPFPRVSISYAPSTSRRPTY